ncbi:MAG: DUF2892 domain-containing protein [Thermoanaerobaculia bacterium]
MTVDRYLRLTAGFFIMLSVALGYFVSPWFFAFTAFVGLNLFQSAFTNWCPMISILRAAGVPDSPRPLDRTPMEKTA